MVDKVRKILEKAVEWLLDNLPKAPVPVPVPVNKNPIRHSRRSIR